MPIKPEYRKFYGKEWRTVTRPRILERAGHRCEECGVPNHEYVLRGSSVVIGRFWRLDQPRASWYVHGIGKCPNLSIYGSRLRTVYIVLTIAHLNHKPGDDRDDNLKALCQWCHLNLDKFHHRETRATRKDAARPLLQEARP